MTHAFSNLASVYIDPLPIGRNGSLSSQGPLYKTYYVDFSPAGCSGVFFRDKPEKDATPRVRPTFCSNYSFLIANKSIRWV